jgi:anti-sigma B factor antagonist
MRQQEMSGDQLSIDMSTGNDGKTLVCKLRGSLDLATAPSVRAALVEAAGHGKHDLVVDLTKVEFLDSTGLGALIGAHRRAIEQGGGVRLAVGEGAILRLLAITGLIGVFPTYATLSEALAGDARLESPL